MITWSIDGDTLSLTFWDEEGVTPVERFVIDGTWKRLP